MTIAEVRRSFPHLKAYAERKTRRKLKTKLTLVFRKHGRIAMLHRGSDHETIYLSSRMSRKNPTLSKSAVVHEIAHALGCSHKEAREVQNSYLKSKNTTYASEIRQYCKPKKRSLFKWRV